MNQTAAIAPRRTNAPGTSPPDVARPARTAAATRKLCLGFSRNAMSQKMAPKGAISPRMAALPNRNPVSASRTLGALKRACPFRQKALMALNRSWLPPVADVASRAKAVPSILADILLRCPGETNYKGVILKCMSHSVGDKKFFCDKWGQASPINHPSRYFLNGDDTVRLFLYG